jgi:acyl-CoA thioesterase FadM
MNPEVKMIDCALAHVVNEENLLIRCVWATSEPNVFGSRFNVSGTHPYLYENAAIANHVTGTTFIDVGRQLLKSIAHLYYDIPLDIRFILHGIDVKYLRWVKLGVEVSVRVKVSMDDRPRAEARHSCDVDMSFTQEGRPVVSARTSFTTLSKQLEDKLMARQYAEPSLIAPAVATRVQVAPLLETMVH